MSERVPSDKIERIVGKPRHWRSHYGRAVSSEQMMYVLHSKNCLNDNPDLRDCDFSVALDNGLDMDKWADYQDRPVLLSIVDGSLWPRIFIDGISPVRGWRK